MLKSASRRYMRRFRPRRQNAFTAILSSGWSLTPYACAGFRARFYRQAASDEPGPGSAWCAGPARPYVVRRRRKRQAGRIMHIGYARVSTGEQKLDLRLDALKEDGCERIYIDTISGATSSRPELDRCLDQLRAGDTLVVWRLGRFGRSLKDLVTKIEALEEMSVDFVGLTEGIDTTSAQGRLQLHLFGALAEFERELARERTMAGLRAARARGRTGRTGGPVR